MFDIDSGKLLIVGVLALIVIGPKELPRVMRQVGQAVGKLRRMAGEFQGQFMDAMKEADIADIRKELDELNKSAALDVHFDPARDIQTELTSALEPVSVTAAESSAVALTSDPVAVLDSGPVEAPTTVGPEPEPVAPGVDHDDRRTDPSASGFTVPLPKRKIRVKRRASSFHVVRDAATAAMTGEPLSTRRRPVRAKAPELQSALDA